MFSAALASGQLGPLMSQFGLPAEAVDAANKGGECWCWWEQDGGGWGCWHWTQPLSVGCKDQLLANSPKMTLALMFTRNRQVLQVFPADTK